jgi:rubredoxin
MEQQYICLMPDCGYVYDPAQGDPDRGVPPGTPFADLPPDWRCPECGASTAAFAPME